MVAGLYGLPTTYAEPSPATFTVTGETVSSRGSSAVTCHVWPSVERHTRRLFDSSG